MQDYRIQLDTYSGPMDLLLYLIRRDEVDIYDIPIARILGQYLGYVRMIEALDPEAVGEFLVMAATLMEIKSRMLLPKPPPEETGDDGLDPRADLVRQLLAYRAVREAAGELLDRQDTFSRRFGRPAVEVPGEPGGVDLEEVQIWDLLNAFNKLMASVGAQRTFHEVKYDDTPIALHAVDIVDRLQREGPSLRFERIFEGRSRGEMIGLFLALLELIRQKRVRFEQQERCGPIEVHLLDATPIADPDAEDADADSDAGHPDAAERSGTASGETGDGDGQAGAAASAESVGPQEAGRPRRRRPAFLDQEPVTFIEDEQDEYAKRLAAIKVADLDLDLLRGKTSKPAAGSAEAAPSNASEADAPAEAVSADESADDTSRVIPADTAAAMDDEVATPASSDVEDVEPVDSAEEIAEPQDEFHISAIDESDVGSHTDDRP